MQPTQAPSAPQPSKGPQAASTPGNASCPGSPRCRQPTSQEPVLEDTQTLGPNADGASIDPGVQTPAGRPAKSYRAFLGPGQDRSGPRRGSPGCEAHARGSPVPRQDAPHSPPPGVPARAPPTAASSDPHGPASGPHQGPCAALNAAPRPSAHPPAPTLDPLTASPQHLSIALALCIFKDAACISALHSSVP
ncbi:uncharacterized protein LOC101718004 isoform X2 [Heterocephalus glaber]|uniref:Uncharacterized protein LOC101718004 isoform X2 n=1 Tax=Heterocephalus glaber TaxID=10181 RepID=A0AAX6PHF9_HETGA|nr:uncharacterized protein LOC101718004 isoform X2 [Heterocephalus glaber]